VSYPGNRFAKSARKTAAVSVLILALCAAWWAGRDGPRAFVVERTVIEPSLVEEIAKDGGDRKSVV